MKKKQGLRKDSFHIEMNLANGIQKIKGQNYGTYLMVKNIGEHFRVFPISNWTEMDVWQYILHEKIELPSLYFSHQRMVVNRDGVLLAKCEYISLKENEKWEEKTVRCRTIAI